MIRFRHILLFATLVFAMGCDRAFDHGPLPSVTVIEPDLGEIQTESDLLVRMRLDSGSGITGVVVGNAGFGIEGVGEIWSGMLHLEKGLNVFPVSIFRRGESGVADTLWVLRMDMTVQSTSNVLPIGIGGHTATLLNDGRLLVVGGAHFVGDPAIGAAWIGNPDGSPLAELADRPEPRVGHSADMLPDGRVLFLGGGFYGNVIAVHELNYQSDIFEPATNTFDRIAFEGDEIRRMYHSSVMRLEGSRTLVDLFGGRGNVVDGGAPALGIRQDIRTFELSNGTLYALSPTVGALIAPFAGHSQTDLHESAEPAEQLVVGFEYESPLLPGALHFERKPAFGLIISDVAPPPSPTIRHAAVRLADGMVALFGGRNPESDALPESASAVYVDAAGRYFLVPATIRSSLIPRYGHTATLTQDGRILLTGGFNAVGLGIPAMEILTFDLD